ncbi:HRDC domain-containing protein, partial [Escherichia coli]|nr:HRDC domain-containing protein [Escherichia coli]
MRLHARGWRVVERRISNFLPHEGGYLKLGGGHERTRAEFARFSARDAEAFPRYEEALERVAAVLRDMALLRPGSIAAMGNISGVGARKLDAYGDAFLQVIREAA